MPKAHRGKEVRKMAGQARATCPICQRSGIKLLYQREIKEGETTSVCKQCNSTLTKKANG